MLPDPVSYAIHDNGTWPRIPQGKVYTYVFAGNGVFKMAANHYVEACIRLARCRVAGLPTLGEYVKLRKGRLPGHLLAHILRDARRLSWNMPREAMYHLVVEGSLCRLRRLTQVATAAHLSYSGGGEADIVAEIHSHQEMSSFFSVTDNKDEQGFRFYGVIGKIFTRPELRLRLGVYGDFCDVPATTLFTTAGPFLEADDAEV